MHSTALSALFAKTSPLGMKVIITNGWGWATGWLARRVGWGGGRKGGWLDMLLHTTALHGYISRLRSTFWSCSEEKQRWRLRRLRKMSNKPHKYNEKTQNIIIHHHNNSIHSNVWGRGSHWMKRSKQADIDWYLKNWTTNKIHLIIICADVIDKTIGALNKYGISRRTAPSFRGVMVLWIRGDERPISSRRWHHQQQYTSYYFYEDDELQWKHRDAHLKWQISATLGS